MNLLRDHRRVNRTAPRFSCFLAVAGLAFPLSTPAQALDNGERAPQIVIYLENLALTETIAEITLETVSLAGDLGELPLTFTRGELTAHQSSAAQARLVDEEIPEGSYKGVQFLASIRYTVDDTIIVVDSVTATAPYAFVLGPGEIEPVFLEFDIAAAPDTSGHASLRITSVEPRIPPFTSLLFVTNAGSNNISVLDRFSDRVIDVLMADRRPQGMAYSRFTRELYVASAGDNTVTVIDVMTRQVLRRLRLNLNDEPTRLALAPDGQRLYVLNAGSNSLAVFDASSFEEEARISVGLQAVSLDVDPSSGWVYIANELSDDISLFDPADESIVTSIPAGSLPTELVLISPEDLLCVASSGQRIITVLSSSTGNLQSTFGLCAVATGLAYDRVQGLVYVAVGQCKEITAFRPATALSTGQMTLPGEPGLLTIDEDNRKLYACLPKEDRLAIVNLTGRKVAAMVDVGYNPYMALAVR